LLRAPRRLQNDPNPVIPGAGVEPPEPSLTLAHIATAVGASVASDRERTTRVFRDMAVAAAHRNLQLPDMFYGDIGRAALGEPQRVPGR
jgi:hypothetical protein